MMRSTVDLPQPDGPTIATSSPLSGRSWMTNETSWMATFEVGPSPNDFVTLLNRTTSGSGFAGAVAGDFAGVVSLVLMLLPVGVRKKQAPAQPPQLVARDGDQHDDDDDGE